MPNEPSKDSSLFPSSDGEREDSGLQDILAVAAKIKDKPSGEVDVGSDGDDDGVIMFTAGDGGDAGAGSDEDDALFASFSGGLAFDASDASGGMGGSLVDEVSASSASASAATPAAAPPAAASEDSSRKPLVVVAVVLGLALVGIGGVVLLDKGEQPVQQQQAQAEMSAPGGDQVAAKTEEPEPAPADTAAGEVAPEPEPEPEEVADTEELDGVGETEGLGAMGEEEGDPLGTRANLLDKKDSGIAKAGKWDQGESVAKPAADPEPIAEPDPEPDPLPLPEPSGGDNKKVTEDDVDCLLNPDLPKCQAGKEAPKKQQELLAPKVPDKLSSQQLREGFNGVKPAARQCGLKNGVPPGTKVKVKVSIEGPSGKVTSVEAKGEHAGTPLGVCVESAVKGAQFEVFKKPAMGIDYTMVM